MSQQGTLGALKTALKKRMKLINQGYGRYNCHEVELYRVLQLIEELETTGEIQDSSLAGLGSLPAGWYDDDNRYEDN